MFLDDLATRLVTNGVGAAGVNIFYGSASLPTPQNYPKGDATKGNGPYLVLTATGGLAPERVQNKKSANTRQPTAQVLSTAADPAAAWAMIMLAFTALDGAFNEVIGTTFYLSLKAIQEPANMGVDSTGRNSQIVFNVQAEYSA
jgi:hypothetical protein